MLPKFDLLRCLRTKDLAGGVVSMARWSLIGGGIYGAGTRGCSRVPWTLKPKHAILDPKP